MIVTYVYASVLTDQVRTQVRCRNMVDAINRTGTHRAHLLDMVSFVQNTEGAQKICGASDLLVIYRYLYGPVLTAVQYWKARDKKVIVDFDQAFNYLTESMPSYSFWFEGKPLNGLDIENAIRIDPPPIEQFKWGLAMVDAATVPSLRLVDDWSRFTRVHKVMDYINTSHYPAAYQADGDEIWIGPGIGVNRDCLERSGLLAALENVLRIRPQVKLILAGMEMQEVSAAFHVNSEQIKVCSPNCFEDWVDILLHLNIGLKPIFGDYDLRLGSYDLLEFMISKIPWIASEEPTFQIMSQYGQWVPNKPQAWEHAILSMIEELDAHQRRAGRESFLFALNQDLSVNIARILRVYDAILGS